MRPLVSLFLSLALVACGGAEQPVHSASTAPQLFRGGQAEARFRCGSESLRARLREGKLLVQVGSGETAALVPVDDPRSQAGKAYGDGKLTLYKVGNSETWMLARAGTAGDAECKQEPAAP